VAGRDAAAGPQADADDADEVDDDDRRVECRQLEGAHPRGMVSQWGAHTQLSRLHPDRSPTVLDRQRHECCARAICETNVLRVSRSVDQLRTQNAYRSALSLFSA